MGEAKRKAEAMTTGRYACCGNCPYFKRAMPMQPLGTCHERPPTVMLLGFEPPKLAGQQPQPRTGNFWVMTADTEVCGRHPNFVTMQTSIEAIDLSKLDEQEVAGNG